MLSFPKKFFWGAATSSYQVEGNNARSDWWDWERRVNIKEPSGQACLQYSCYKEDFNLAKELHHNCHRFSIEWSRIEPEENKFSSQEIAHYIDVVDALNKLHIEPVVTLHHFTNPLWFALLGGWQHKKAEYYYLRYVERIVGVLCDKVRYWVTINEPMVYIYHSYIIGVWPPQEKSFDKARVVENNLTKVHIKAYALIHHIYKKKNLPSPSVSIAANLYDFTPCSPTLKNRLGVFLRNRLFNCKLLGKLIRSKSLDFIGLNYYTRNLVDVSGWRMKNLLLDTCRAGHSKLKKNSLGWDIYPQGLFNILMRLKKYNLPVFILENGICTPDDNLRWEFISQHLLYMHRAIEKGARVIGYLYWSLIDNYEWDKGFSPRFGLIEVNYNNYQRMVRESARKFSEVCNANAF